MGIAPDRLVGDKIDALKLDSVLARCPQITQSERRMGDEPSPLKSFPDVHEKQGSVSAQSRSKGPTYSPQSMHMTALCLHLSIFLFTGFTSTCPTSTKACTVTSFGVMGANVWQPHAF